MADERLIAQLKKIETSPGDLWEREVAARARIEIETLTRERDEALRAADLARIDQDNANGALEYMRKQLYPFVMREAGPLPLPLERIAGLVARRLASEVPRGRTE